MRRSTSFSLPSLASVAFVLATAASSVPVGGCAGASMANVGTGKADTVDEGGSDDDGEDDDDDDAPASGDDAAETEGSVEDSSGAHDDAGSSGGDHDTTAAATNADDGTTDASASTDDAGSSDESGSASAAEDSTTDDSGAPDSVDLSGFIVLQTASEREIVIPDGTIVDVGGAIVIGRDASLGQFEDFWGVTLDDVVYLDGGDNFPTCNGDETFTLLTPLRTIVDGPTVPLVISTGIERTDASADASEAGAWTSSLTPNSDATPGSGLASGGETGVPYIAEVVDATGPGNFPFEFVEIRVSP